MATTLYNTAYVASRLGIHQAHFQRLVKRGDLAFQPDFRVKGVGIRPPQYAWSEGKMNALVTLWQEEHGKLPT